MRPVVPRHGGTLKANRFEPTGMSSPRPDPVQTAAPGDADRLVETLVLAFSADPLMRWFFPTAPAYLRWFPEFVSCYAGAAFAAETAHYVGDATGVALWYAPDVEADETALIELMQEALDDDQIASTWDLQTALEAAKPAEPHWHLRLIGVDPTQRGRGRGSALLAYWLDRCDDRAETAYLESANPRNLSLYRRHGFEVLDVVEVEDVPPVFPMHRRPH